MSLEAFAQTNGVLPYMTVLTSEHLLSSTYIFYSSCRSNHYSNELQNDGKGNEAEEEEKKSGEKCAGLYYIILYHIISYCINPRRRNVAAQVADELKIVACATPPVE